MNHFPNGTSDTRNVLVRFRLRLAPGHGIPVCRSFTCDGFGVIPTQTVYTNRFGPETVADAESKRVNPLTRERARFVGPQANFFRDTRFSDAKAVRNEQRSHA